MAEVEVETSPTFLKGVVAAEGWREVQYAWEGLPALAAQLSATQAPFDWDVLRLHLHRLVAQFAFPEGLLPPAAKSLLVTLIHRRIDFALETVTRARQAGQAYSIGTPPRPENPDFGPMEAMKGMEKHVVLLQQGGNLPPITKAIYSRVGGDDNLDLLARLRNETGATARATLWPVLCEWVLALSFCSDPLDLCLMSLEAAVAGADPIRLLQETIKGDPPLKVAEAATRVAERASDAAVIPTLTTLLSGRYPNRVKQGIANALKAIGDATATAQLIRLALADTADSHDDGLPYYRVRLAAMVAVAAIAERDPAQIDVVVPALRQAAQRETLGAQSRLQAILLLARHFRITEGYQYACDMVVEAAVRDYAETRDLAAEALAAMGNPQSLNMLVQALQHVDRPETTFERMRPVGSDRPDALLNALRSFGMEMHWNAGAQRWVKGPQLLADGQPAPELPRLTAGELADPLAGPPGTFTLR